MVNLFPCSVISMACYTFELDALKSLIWQLDLDLRRQPLYNRRTLPMLRLSSPIILARKRARQVCIPWTTVAKVILNCKQIDDPSPSFCLIINRFRYARAGYFSFILYAVKRQKAEKSHDVCFQIIECCNSVCEIDKIKLCAFLHDGRVETLANKLFIIFGQIGFLLQSYTGVILNVRRSG